MQKSLITLMLLLLTALPTAAFAEQALVPQSGSGQVLCYNATGADIPCAGTGQDVDLQMGIPWPNPRFVDNGNGTTSDNLTGLVWLKNANCFSTSWNGALTSANTLASGACGLTDGSVAGDWRLPNSKELESLINRRQTNPGAWLNTVGFSGVSSNYWSSSSYSTDTNTAWYCQLAQGGCSFTSKLSGMLVLLVRGGL
jgi:hypothetical protein